MLDLSVLTKLERDAFAGFLKHLVTKNQDALWDRELLALDVNIAAPFRIPAFRGLVKKGFLRTFITGPDDGGWKIDPAIVADVYESWEKGAFECEPAIVPAANRFVPIDHNSPAYAEADEALEQIEVQLTGNNELFADADQRLAVMREVHGIRESLQSRFIRAQVLLTYLQGSLAWLASQFFSGAIRTLAGKVITYLTGLM